MARAMKDSGIAWIGVIPEEWIIERNKNCFSCGKEIVGNASSDTQLLSLTTRGVIEKPNDSVGGKMPESFDTYQIVYPDNMVMCLFDLDCSAVFSGLSPFYGMISPAYKVLVCKNNVLPRYADYWFSFVFQDRKFKAYAKNLRYTLNYDEFAALPMVVPPRPKQRLITGFLDHKCAEIDAVIEQTRASIEEYKALKQSIITEAVTKGIRGDRPMKDSGIAWIGEIAEDYGLQKLKYAAEILDQFRSPITADQRNQDAEVLYDYYGASGAIDKIDGYTIDDHVMLIGEDGANLRMRNLPLMYEVNGKAWINNHAHILKPKANVDFYYLFYTLEALDINPYITGSAQPKLSQENLKNIWLPIPSIEEQYEIVEYLKCRISEIGELVERKRAFLLELESYKKSVIYECVTGKKVIS